MTISSVQRAFEQFEKEQVRVPDAQNKRAKEVHPVIRSAVEKELGELYNRAFLAGSYARRVQTVRLKDVDVIVVLNDPDGIFKSSANAALERLRTAAKTCELTAGTRKGIRAIKVVIDGVEFTIDLVATLEDPLGELLLACFLPGEGRDDWTRGRPQGQLNAHRGKNDATNGVFVPAVRIVKYWNQRTMYNGKNALPSYLAESILFHAMTGEIDYATAVAEFFRNAKRHLSLPFATVPCPGNPENFVDERLDEQRRQAALQKVTAALVDAEAALAEPDVAKATRLWQKVLGPAFPTVEDDTATLASALREGTAVAAGAAISAAPADGRQVIRSRPWRQP